MDIVQGVRFEIKTQGADKLTALDKGIGAVTTKIAGLNNASLSGLTSNLNAAAQAAAAMVSSVEKSAHVLNSIGGRQAAAATQAAETSARARVRSEQNVTAATERAAQQQQRATERSAAAQQREADRTAKMKEAAEWRTLVAAERVEKRKQSEAERVAKAREAAEWRVLVAAEKAARQQQQAAERTARVVAREADRAAREAERASERAANAAEREAKRAANAVERESKRATAAVEREMKRRQTAVERAARSEEREAMSMATRAARSVQRNWSLDKLTDGQKGALSTLGLDATKLSGMNIKDAAKAINDALGGIQDKAQRTRVAFQLLGQGAAGATPQIGGLGGAFQMLLTALVTGGGAGLGAALTALINPLTIILAVVAAVAIAAKLLIRAVEMAAQAMFNAARTGVEYNSFLIEAQLGISSLVMTYGRWVDAQGRVVTSTRAFANSQKLAAEILEYARIAALETTATFPEMVRALQEGMGPALQAGFNPRQVVAFTQAMTQAAGAIGLPFDQLGQEIRGVLEFDFSKNSRIARMLFQGLGKSAEELRNQFAGMSEAARFDFVMQRLQAFREAGAELARTPKGALSNLKDAYQQILGTGTVQLTKDFTSAVLDLSASFLITGTNKEKAFNPALIQTVKDIYKAVDQLGMELFDVVEAWSALNGGSLEFKGETAMLRMVDAIKQVTREIRVLMGSYQEWQDMSSFNKAMPWGGLLALNRGEDRVTEEDEWMKGIKDPKVASWMIQNSKTEADRKWIRENVDWLKSFQAGNMPEPSEGATFNTGDIGDMYDQYAKPDDADTAKKIEQQRASLEVSKAQATLAGTISQTEREALTLAIGRLQADEKLLKAKADIAKTEGSANQKKELSSLAEAADEQDILQSKNAYSVAMDRITRQSNEQVRAAQANLEITKMQIGAAGKLDELVRAQINHRVALAQIENERQSTRAGIDPGSPNRGKLEALADATARAKALSENIAYQESIAETTREQHEQTRAMTFAADQAERNLDIAKATAEIEKAKTAEILTQADVMKLAGLQRLAIDQEYQSKRIELEEETRRAVVEQEAIIAASRRRMDLGVSVPEDVAAVQRATDRITQIVRKGAADLERERVQRDSRVAAVFVEMQRNMRAARQQEAEQRASESATVEAERSLDIARQSLEVERLRSAEIMTQGNAVRIADAERLLAEKEFEAQRIKIAQDAFREIEEQRAIIQDASSRINGNFDGVVATPADFAAVERAIARIREIQSKANALQAKERLAYNANLTNIDINEQRNRQDALNVLRNDAYAIELAEKIIRERKKGTIEGAEAARAAAATLTIYLDMLDRMEQHWHTIAKGMADAVTSAFEIGLKGGKLSDIFKSVGSSFQKIAMDDINAFIQEWGTKLANAANGRDASGNVIPAGQPGSIGSSQQKGAKAGMYGAQVAGAAASGYAAGQGNGQATIGAALAAFGTYASTGNIYVAIAAAIASLIGSAISGQQARDQYKYAAPGFGSGGRATLHSTQNILDSELDLMRAKFQGVVNDQWNSWVNIMLKLPGAIIPNINKLIPTANDPIRKVQDKPSANFMKHWDEYLANDLPKYIASKFKDGLKAAFTDAMSTMVKGPITEDVKKALGKQFEAFWAEAEGLDKNIRVEFWSNLADGLNSFANAARRLSNVNKALQNLGSSRLDENGNFKVSGDSDFVSNLKAGAQGIFDQARAMVNLTGPDRVAAFKALGASVETVTKALSEYIGRVADAIRRLRDAFDDAAFQHKLFMAGERRDANGEVIHEADKNAQARIMEAEYNRIVDKIKNAAALGLSPEEVEALSNRAMGLLNDIFMLDPTDAADAWWTAQMEALQAISEQALLDLGTHARDAVDRLLEQVQPFVDWFNGLPVDLAAAQALLTGPGGAFDGFADALADLTERVKETLPGGGTDRPGGGIDPPIGDPRDPNEDGGGRTQHLTSGGVSVSSLSAPGGGDTYNFSFGNVYGVDDLHEQIRSAIEYAANNNPNSLRRKW